MTNDTGGPAMPVTDLSKTQCPGMSLCDYFAAKAMQAMVAAHIKYNRDPRKRGGDDPLFDYATPDCESILEDREANAQIIAETAYSIADAMLAARSEKEGK